MTTASGRLDRSRYELEAEDTFDDDALDPRRWIPRYLPHWTREPRSEARYELGPQGLVLRIDEDQPAWSPEYTGELRVSSLQTGALSGPTGSGVGQHRFRDDLVVRTAQPPVRLYTPHYGLLEVRARFTDDPSAMAAFWLIGYEDEPGRSAELCVAEIFGRDVRPDSVGVGMGIHPFHDPSLHDEFERVRVPIDAREAHDYAAEWTPEAVRFHVDGRLVKVVEQSPGYPMQVMLDIFEFRSPDAASSPMSYPKRFVIESFRGHRLAGR